MNADKPTGLQLDEFLPRKFSGLGFNYNTKEGSGSKYSGFKSYAGMGEDMSESEVTSSIIKGHDGMMAVLTTRGRNMEIIQKLWQGKDAQAAVDQAVSLGDQAIMVDFLSVITLRPSIWNLDLCESLLPVIGDLLQSKYEMYINVGCGAMKLILKNFASVIKSNIDSPIQTVGVDISREERHRKCMQCYKDLVKTRALILKRQSMQGKLGHSMRELAILMQYID
jgi:katanin p80 WD40 repeat-containing subunit B1